MHTRIKFCGIRSPEHAKFAEDLGVDAIGMVFVPDTPRFIDLQTASAICDSTGPFINRVGLFVNPSADEVMDVLAEVDLDVLQFHGEEAAEFCESFGFPYLKAVRVQSADQVIEAAQTHARASGLLLDSHSSRAQGGTGETFDWSLIPQVDKPILLAGGLNPENVAQAIAKVKPYAVDVSSGIESAPGLKDADRMRAFVSAVAG